MILLTFNAAISNEQASTLLEFNVVQCCGAAISTNFVCLFGIISACLDGGL
jgi:hypothetical protein